MSKMVSRVMGSAGGGFAVETGLAGVFAHAVGLLEDDFAAVADDDDCAGELLLRDGGVDGGGDGGEVGGGLRKVRGLRRRFAVSNRIDATAVFCILLRHVKHVEHMSGVSGR